MSCPKFPRANMRTTKFAHAVLSSAALVQTAFCITRSSDDCPSTKIKSLGCYNEESIGLFTHTLTMNTNNSVLNCTGRCREASFTFAAMLNGTGCSCGNLQPLGTHRRPATECNVDCPGEPSEKCGGPANRITSHYVEPYGTNWINVIESTDLNGNFHSTNLLVDACEDRTLSGKTTFWLPPSGATGLNAHFIIEMGCKRLLDRVTLRNTEPSAGRSTKNFQIDFSEDQFQWTTVMSGTLPTPRVCSNPLSVAYKFRPRPARFVRFVANSFEGNGAGLEHFNVTGPVNAGCL